MGDGDGTVNVRSLSACSKWATEQKQAVYIRPFPTRDHMAVLSVIGHKFKITTDSLNFFFFSGPRNFAIHSKCCNHQLIKEEQPIVPTYSLKSVFFFI